MDSLPKGKKKKSFVDALLSHSAELRNLLGGSQFKKGSEIGIAIMALLTVVSLNIFSFASWLPASLYVFIDSVFIINHVSLLAFVYVISRFFGIFVGGLVVLFYSLFVVGLRFGVLMEARQLQVSARSSFLGGWRSGIIMSISGRHVRKYLAPLVQIVITYLVFCYFYLSFGSALFFSFSVIFTLLPAAIILAVFSLSIYRGLRFISFVRFYVLSGGDDLISGDFRRMLSDLRNLNFRVDFLEKLVPFATKIGMLCLLLLSNALGDARANTLLSRLEGELRWADNVEKWSPFASTASGIIFVKEVVFNQASPASRNFSPEKAAFVFIPYDQIVTFDATIEYRH